MFLYTHSDPSADCEGFSHDAVGMQVKYEQNQKALRMVLEDSTLEEAMWALGQVTGLCHLSLRPRQDGRYHSGHIQRVQPLVVMSDCRSGTLFRLHFPKLPSTQDTSMLFSIIRIGIMPG